MQSTMSPQTTDIHIFHIIDICSSANMPATLHMYVPLHYYCSLHIELNSNMHMYYAFSKHIYSLSSMTTYVYWADTCFSMIPLIFHV